MIYTYREYWQRGQQYYAAYKRNGATDALARAVSDLRFAAQLVRDAVVPHRHNILGRYASACRSAALHCEDHSARRTALDEAVASFVAALQSAPQNALETSFLWIDLAAVLVERGGSEPEDDLTNAINACQSAITCYARQKDGFPYQPDDDFGYFMALLGDVHRHRFRRTLEEDVAAAGTEDCANDREREHESELKQAAEALRQAIVFLEPETSTAAETRLQLSEILLTSYSRSLRASDLEEAIAVCEAVPGDPVAEANRKSWAAAHRRNASLARALLLRNRLYDLDLIQSSPDPGQAEKLASAVLRPDMEVHRKPPPNAWITALLVRVDGWLASLHRGRAPVEDEDGAKVHLPPESAVLIADAAVKQMEKAIRLKFVSGFPLAAACYERLSTAYRERRFWAGTGGGDPHKR